jgi:hypothetical protein
VTESVLPAEQARTVSRVRLRSLLREEVVARAALGAIALHVVDDSFLQPQPGTSAADHLAGGLVPTALLLLFAWAYPRLRAGLRASLALVAGFLALGGGIEAYHYGREVGLSGDDYTGILSVAAGLALLGTGAVTLWRTRRGGRVYRRYGRRALLAVAGAFVAFQLFTVVYTYGLTHVARTPVERADLGRPYEDVSFRTSDGLELDGWYLPSRNGAAVIAFPGRKGPQAHARMLARHGYGVLMFDRRGEGTSEGDPNALGWAGDRDLKAALSYLAGRPDVEPGRVGGLGLSVGGELLLETAAEDERLAAVVSEGAGMRSIHEARELGGPDVLSMFAVATAATAVFSNHLPPPNLKELVGRIAPRPIFLIHATKGQGGEELNPEYYDAAGEPKQLWEISQGAHTDGIEVVPQEYERRVVGFFDDALLGTS